MFSQCVAFQFLSDSLKKVEVLIWIVFFKSIFPFWISDYCVLLHSTPKMLPFSFDFYPPGIDFSVGCKVDTQFLFPLPQVYFYVVTLSIENLSLFVHLFSVISQVSTYVQVWFFFFFFFFFLVFCLFRPTPAAYGGSQARGLIRAAVANLRHSHNNTGSKLRLQPTPQLTAMPDP